MMGVVTMPLLHVGPSYSVPLQLHWNDSSVLAGVSIGRQTPPFRQGLDSHGLLASICTCREQRVHVAICCGYDMICYGLGGGKVSK